MLKFILGVAIGGIIVWVIFKSKSSVLNQEQIEEKKKNLEEIMEMTKAKDQIANDDIEKALGISDQTATRYLEELENQGKLQQIGRGPSSAYISIQ